MKGIIRLIIAVILVFAASLAWYSCTKDVSEAEEGKGSIFGFVYDAANRRLVEGANVILRQTGESYLTGSNGKYEFSNVKDGTYSIKVSKVGYSDLIDTFAIVVSGGGKVQRDIQIEGLPSALRVVDSRGEDVSILDFGAAADVTSRTFSIFNDSPDKIRWWIVVEDCDWIASVKSMISSNPDGDSGELMPGGQEPIKVTINRDLVGVGVKKTYILNINSDHGSKELTITAGEDHGLPQLKTNDVSDCGQNSVTFHGTITDPGNPPYTERGFVYSNSEQPSLTDNVGRVTAVVDGSNQFSARVSGLSSNASYYVRAYAKNNNDGVGYGNDVFFSTGIVKTRVETSQPTNVDANSATFNGTILERGNPSYTEKGFCYGTSYEPKITDNKIAVNDGNIVGEYHQTVNNLVEGVTYYVRAYAIQPSQEPEYGEQKLFTTSGTPTRVETSAPSNIQVTSATLNGTILEIGSPEYSEKGFCYNTNSSRVPTINDSKVIVSGRDGGPYSTNIANLAKKTTYYVRAYAIQNGTPIYGGDSPVSFTTVWVDARVQTSNATNVQATSAKLNGVVLEAGTPAYSEKGFYYTTYPDDPRYGTRVSLMASGNFSYTLNGLSEGTRYNVVAYVKQDGITVFADNDPVSFTTAGQTEQPVVSTNAISNLTPVSSAGIITSWKVTFNGYVSNPGTPAYVEKGFCYGTSMNPTGNRQKVSGTGTGSFSKTITGLQNYQTYYVRAYVKTSTGTYIYGENESFQTYDW